MGKGCIDNGAAFFMSYIRDFRTLRAFGMKSGT